MIVRPPPRTWPSTDCREVSADWWSPRSMATCPTFSHAWPRKGIRESSFLPTKLNLTGSPAAREKTSNQLWWLDTRIWPRPSPSRSACRTTTLTLAPHRMSEAQPAVARSANSANRRIPRAERTATVPPKKMVDATATPYIQTSRITGRHRSWGRRSGRTPPGRGWCDARRRLREPRPFLLQRFRSGSEAPTPPLRGPECGLPRQREP